MPRYKLTFWTDLLMPKGSIWHRCPILPMGHAGTSPVPLCMMAGVEIDTRIRDCLHGRDRRQQFTEARDTVGASLDAIRKLEPSAKVFTVGVPAIERHERPDEVGMALRHVLQSADAVCIDCSHAGLTANDMVEIARRNRRAFDASHCRRPLCCLVRTTIDGHLLPERLVDEIADAVWEARPQRVVVQTGIEPILDVACRESSEAVVGHDDVLAARRQLLATYGAVPERWTRKQAKASVMRTLGPWMDRLREALLSRSNPKEVTK